MAATSSPISPTFYHLRTLMLSEIHAASCATVFKNLHTLFPAKQEGLSRMQIELYPRLDFFRLALLSSVAITANLALALIFTIASAFKHPYREDCYEVRSLYWYETGLSVATMGAASMGTLIPKYGILAVGAIDLFGVVLDYKDIRQLLPEELQDYLPEEAFSLKSLLVVITEQIKTYGQRFFNPVPQENGQPSENTASFSDLLNILNMFQRNISRE